MALWKVLAQDNLCVPLSLHTRPDISSSSSIRQHRHQSHVAKYKSYA